jgi:ribokinase
MSVYVIGGINQDIVATSESHPRPGETLTGSDLNYYPGGKGANQAIAAARAGASVAMIGCTGNDAAGNDLRNYLADAGVDVSRVRARDEAPTGTALIVVANGENSIIVVLGANEHVAPDSLDGLSFTEEDIVVAQFETPIETTLTAFKRARKAGARTILNPSPVTPIQPELLSHIDFLVVNEHEFELIFETPLAPVLTDNAGKPDAFTGTLVITLGSEGVLTLTEKDRIRQAGQAVEVVDSTGAGDCFVGYLASALHNRDSLASAIELANLAASISVTRPGAASSIPDLKSLSQP